MENVEQILIKVEKDLKDELKIAAIRHGKSLKDLMIDATLEWIAINESKLNK